MSESTGRGRAIVILFAALVGIVLTCRLGVWQLDRAAEKQSLHDTRVARQKMPALSNANLACDPKDWAQQEQRQAAVQGRWLHEKSVVLDNRIMAGRPGFFVLTPLLLDPAPACGSTALLVQRGWLPRDATDRSRIPAWSKPQGLVQVPVRLTFAPSKNLSLQSEPMLETSLLRQNVDVDALKIEWHLALLPASAEQLDKETSQTAEGKPQAGEMPLGRDWWLPTAGVEKHQAYAAQWFLMALTITGLYIWYQWWQPAKEKTAPSDKSRALK